MDCPVLQAFDRGAVRRLESDLEFVALRRGWRGNRQRHGSGVGAQAGCGDFERVFVVVLGAVVGAAFERSDFHREGKAASRLRTRALARISAFTFLSRSGQIKVGAFVGS